MVNIMYLVGLGSHEDLDHDRLCPKNLPRTLHQKMSTYHHQQQVGLGNHSDLD